MFADRNDAGRRLAAVLEAYRDSKPLILAIPRGGVEVGCRVAERLNAELSVLIVRKLPFPDSPESGFGAIAEDGTTVLLNRAVWPLSPDTVQDVIDSQKAEIKRRIRVLRGGRPLPRIRGRIVILVDDGLAMGSTMRAAILLSKKRGAARVVSAVPVAGRQAERTVRRLADQLVVLEQPPDFRAVAQVYRNWYDVSDQEVLELLESDACKKSIQTSGRGG
jgi:predicted phosphoribosyltransferase